MYIVFKLSELTINCKQTFEGTARAALSLSATVLLKTQKKQKKTQLYPKSVRISQT